MKDKKTYFRHKIKEDIPKNAKIVLFRNPKEFKLFQLEKVNPDHKIRIWGKLKKKYRKDNYNKFINVGKILLPGIFFSMLDLSLLIELLPCIISSFISCEVFLLIVFRKELIKCLLELRAVLEAEKRLCLSDI